MKLKLRQKISSFIALNALRCFQPFNHSEVTLYCTQENISALNVRMVLEVHQRWQVTSVTRPCGSCQMSFSAEPNHKEKSEECKKAAKIRRARIRRSRLLYSAPAEAVKMTKRNTPGVAVAECLECGMRFVTERAYKSHKVSHTDKYKCEHCQISFSTNRKHKKEDCKKVGKFRKAQIKTSRLLFSAPEILPNNQSEKHEANS